MNIPIKVMLVDDSFLIRVLLKTILDQDEQKRFKVVASESNGQNAINKLLVEEVDVILMDIEMPIKNGLEALKEIMEKKPTPVIMFSSLTKKGAKETIEALSLRAVDFILKPEIENHRPEKKLKDELYEKITRAATVNLKNVRSYKPVELKNKPLIPTSDHTMIKSKPGEALHNLIAVGCSTGGPTALEHFLNHLPKDLKAGIVITQHMPEGKFTASLAERLNNISEFQVKEAEEGDEILDGKVYIAPGGYHLEVFKRGEKYQCVLNKREPVMSLRPSVDVMFISISRIKNPVPVYGVVLTGMGSDGTNGCFALKRENATILVESEKTATIYGMPKQVAVRGLADYIEDLDDLIPKIEKLIKKR